MDFINSIILCMAFTYLLFEKIENTNNVKIPDFSLILFLLIILITNIKLIATTRQTQSQQILLNNNLLKKLFI